MKKHLPGAFALILLFMLSVATHSDAQVQVSIPNPTGYPVTYFNIVNGIATDNANNFWVAYGKVGLGKYDGSAWTVYDSLSSPLPNNKILSVACGASGVWAGTNSGLFFFNGSTWTSYNTGNSNINTDSITTLYAKGNDVWFYGNTGFTWFNGTTFQQFNTGNSSLINNNVNCMLKDAAGTLWIGTAGGLSSFDGVTWQNFTISNSNLPDNDIRSLAEDGNHYLYVGTYTYGLLIKHGNSFDDWDVSCGTHFDMPRVLHLFSISDGSILLASNTNTFIYSSPASTVARRSSGYASYSDSAYYYAIDNLDRIWKTRKVASASTTKRIDSLTTAPLINQVSPGTTFLDVNKVSCPIWSDNTFFWDAHAQTNLARYEVPKGCGRTALFAHALWFGGLDAGNNLHVAAQTYRQMGNDWWSGPLDTVGCHVDSATVAAYSKVWKVNRDTVIRFNQQFALGNVTNGNYPVPTEIADWPGNGTGLASQNLAPYFDYNGDNNYNPYDGDYPLMKGDQMLWWVMNDAYGVHTETGGLPFCLEVRGEAWAYDCSSIADSLSINYTTFYSYQIINRNTTETYHDTYVGMWTDVDLGNADDDFIGCRVDEDYGYAYNADNIDESLQGYGTNPPMISCAVLKGPEADAGDGLDNNHDGVTDEAGESCMMNHFMYYGADFTIHGNPTTAADYYGYLISHWLDNSHLLYGGRGDGTGCGATSMPTDYIFSGMPYDTGWTEASACNAPGDRRFLMSSGPFSMYPGQTKTLDYAMIFSWDRNDTNGAATSVARNHHDVMEIKNMFDTDTYPCHQGALSVNETTAGVKDFIVFPNPATGIITVDAARKFSSTASLQLFDISGREIRNEKNIHGRTTIDVSGFERGIYFIQLSDANHNATKKIVLQ
jgi:hypothetical protein